MITERPALGVITILEDGQIQLREDIVIERDGVEINRLHHRRVLEPSSTHTETEPRLVRIIGAVWTTEVITEFRRRRQALLDSVNTRR